VYVRAAEANHPAAAKTPDPSKANWQCWPYTALLVGCLKTLSNYKVLFQQSSEFNYFSFRDSQNTISMWAILVHRAMHVAELSSFSTSTSK
jgi:hypothetical protein